MNTPRRRRFKAEQFSSNDPERQGALSGAAREIRNLDGFALGFDGAFTHFRDHAERRAVVADTDGRVDHIEIEGVRVVLGGTPSYKGVKVVPRQRTRKSRRTV